MTDSQKPIENLTAEQLHERASDYRNMAAAATTEHARDALLKLAKRFEANATEREKAAEYHPGEPAPIAGTYEELNLFGSRTGRLQHVQEDEPLPALPRGFTWRFVAGAPGRDGDRGSAQFPPEARDGGHHGPPMPPDE